MADIRKPIFDALRGAVGPLSDRHVSIMTDALNQIGVPREMDEVSDLTGKAVCYCLHEEGLVREAYKDSVGVWTAFGGVTNASGHEVYPRYKDNPQTIQKGLEVTVWLMRNRYLAPVLKAFEGYPLQEHELAAALSFHWNTGAIGTTSWVSLVKQGKIVEARTFLETHYLNNGTLTARRKREASLFFNAIWPADLKVPVYPVSKPSYTPSWGKAEMVDFAPIVADTL